MFLYVFADFGAPLNYQVLPLGLAYNQFPNGTLLISSVDKASKGAYTCTAQNGIRSAISKTINVTVNGVYIYYCILYYMHRFWIMHPPNYPVFQSKRNFGAKKN